jgi:hypothetical protein
MKKFLILLLTISLISCSKDEIQTAQPNYSAFLNNRTPSLTGKLNSQLISWKFAWNEFQMFTGYSNGNDVFSITDPVRNLMFGLTSNGASTQLKFITPKMDTSNQNEVKSVLSVGEKQFGEIYNKFHFSILKNNNFYSNNPNTNQKLEILKTEEFLNYDNKKRLLVWIKIDNLELENANQSGEKIQLKDGYLIAELIGNIFE